MEKGYFVDQKKRPTARDRVERLVGDHPEIFQRQASVVASWRTYRGRRLGPYYRLAYRQGGRQRSIYLGTDRQVVEAIRRRLDQCREPQRQEKGLAQLRRAARRALAQQKRRLRNQLGRAGLTLKGNEIRGFRQLARGVKQAAAASAPTPFARKHDSSHSAHFGATPQP